MIVKTTVLLLAVAAAIAYKPQEGVDPNTLSCDPEGQIFLLLPHFTDCTKFFMCTHGEEVEFSCNGGLIFDFELQGCNWSWATTCILRNPKEEEEIEGSGEEEFVWKPNDEEHVDVPLVKMRDGPEEVMITVRPAVVHKLNTAQYDNILNCNRADAASRQVPYKGDCQRYWRCVDGVPTALYCSDGLFFNERTQQCDFEANTKCVDQTDDELKGEFLLFK